MNELINFATENWWLAVVLLLIIFENYRTVGFAALAMEIFCRVCNWIIPQWGYPVIIFIAILCEVYDGHTYYKKKYDEAVTELKKKYDDKAVPNLPYTVKVTAPSVCVHSAPDNSCKTDLTLTDHGVYTIVEEIRDNGALWGKLKSGAGWILLHKDYAEKL